MKQDCLIETSLGVEIWYQEWLKQKLILKTKKLTSFYFYFRIIDGYSFGAALMTKLKMILYEMAHSMTFHCLLLDIDWMKNSSI